MKDYRNDYIPRLEKENKKLKQQLANIRSTDRVRLKRELQEENYNKFCIGRIKILDEATHNDDFSKVKSKTKKLLEKYSGAELQHGGKNDD